MPSPSTSRSPTSESHSPTDAVALPTVQMHIYRPNDPITVRVTRNDICTQKKASGFIRHVEFDVSGTLLEGQVFPGQAIGVLAPGTDEKGRPHAVRLYSVASPSKGEDGLGKIISTTVKRTIDESWENHKLFLGVCSNYLCDLQVGDQIRLSGPNGKKFLLPIDTSAHDYLFFATGTGIAPFRGMVLDLLRADCKSQITLVMGSPFGTDLIYDDLFQDLAARYSNFRYLTAISREPRPEIQRGYVQDRIRTHQDLLGPMLASPRTLIYICGVAGMELGIFKEMVRTLPASTYSQYISADEATMNAIDRWDRKMLHRELKVSKRVFLEVYA